MGSSRGYNGGSDMMEMLENSNKSLWVPSSSSSFHENMNSDHERRQGRRAMAKRDYDGDGDDTGEDEFDINPYRQSEKKRRLSPNQVQFLEKSFEMENKLEPERKVELAKELGLQPRQVAIWFQNRRARYKTKQLEKDYDSLKASYDRLNLDYDSLSKEKDDLQNEIKTLTKKLKQRDGVRESISKESLCHLDTTMPKWETQMLDKTGLMAVPSAYKQLALEDANSAKSDVVDSDSLHYVDGNHSSLMLEDPTDQQSDFSQGEVEHLMLNRRVSQTSLSLPPLLAYNNMLKVEEEGSYDDPIASSCNFSLVDDQPLLSWLC